MSTTLPLFWNLSSNAKGERIEASVKLIEVLEDFQRQYAPQQKSDQSEDDEEEEEKDKGAGEDVRAQSKSDGLDGLNAPDVTYSIRRLIRGLASPRESSRLGFAVALTELLSRLDTITCSQVLSMVMNASQTSGSLSGQEERDMLFARLFGLTAIIQAGLLVRADASTLLDFETVVDELIKLSDKKSFLRQSCWWSLCLAVDTLEGASVSWKRDAVKSLVTSLFEDYNVWSQEKIALTAKMQILYPQMNWATLLSPTFKQPAILSSANLPVIARILKESSVDEEDGAKSAASWIPTVHFAWDVILDSLIPPADTSRSPAGSLQEFFHVVVDESLFSSTASPQRKYWGFQIFQKALPRVSQEELPMLFTKNFMRSWINHLSNTDRYLHKASRQVAAAIHNLVQTNPAMGFALVLQLTGVHGSQQFDRLTKTKTIESILTSMDSLGLNNYITYLLASVNRTNNSSSEDASALENRRLWIVDQLSTLVKNGAVPKNDEWLQVVLDWLVVGGLFAVEKASSKSKYHAIRSPPEPALTDKVQKACRQRVLTCLADLTSYPITAKKMDLSHSRKASARASDGEFWVTRVLLTIMSLEKDPRHVRPLHPLREVVVGLREKALTLINNLKLKMVDDDNEPSSGGVLLLSASLLHLQCAGSENEEDIQSLESSITSVSDMFPLSDQKPRKKRTSKVYAATTQDGQPSEPVDIVVDTIIGYLEKSTAYMRVVADQVFTLMSSQAKASTVDLIIAQLERRNPADEADNADVEMDGTSANEEGDDPDDDDEEEEDESEGGFSDNEEIGHGDAVDPELRKKIAEALKAAESGDQAQSSEEELMDDDQMIAIDDKLAAVFRERKGERRNRKDLDAQRQATHFKNRVLDLVDIYLKKQASNPLSVLFIVPLVDLIMGSGPDEKQLVDKATGIIRSRIGKSKETVENIDHEMVVEQLKAIHDRARRKARSAEVLRTLSQTSIYLARVLLQDGRQPEVVMAYRDSLADFVTRKNSFLNNGFFHEFIHRYPLVAWDLRDDLLSLAERAVNAYRQTQSFQLIQPLVQQLSVVPKKDVPTFLASLNATTSRVANEALAADTSMTIPQLRDILKITVMTLRQTMKILGSEATQKIWHPATWQAFAKALALSKKFKGSGALQKLARQMALGSNVGTHSLSTPQERAVKRKADGEVRDQPEKRKKQSSQGKEA